MSKISIYEAADKWVGKESVSISAQELKAYVTKRESQSIQVKRPATASKKK